MTLHRLTAPLLALGISFTLIGRTDAGLAAVGGGGVTSTNHVSDGQFGTNEWTAVTPIFFPQVGNAGGAYLYADEGLGSQAGNLYLAYDYVDSPAGANASNSFFDVFFQVSATNTDYDAHLNATSFSLFEKPTGTVSSLNADGSLDVNASPWTPVANSDSDFALGRFAWAIGFGPSPKSAANHLIAEFNLGINTNQSGQPPDGLYDGPGAADFWSAESLTSGAVDPPITSAIFILNPDGTTSIVPAVNSNGAPVQQPQDVGIPEPSSLVLLGLGAMGLISYRRKR